MRGVSQVGCLGTRPPCSITRKPAASGNCGGFDGGSAKSPRLQASWLATQSKLATHLMVSGFLLVWHSRYDVVMVWCGILAAIGSAGAGILGSPPCSGRTWADRCWVWRFPL